MNTTDRQRPILFTLDSHPLLKPLCDRLEGVPGQFDTRQFPDGETYLRITSPVAERDCIVLANLAHPNDKFLPLCFLLGTLRDLGAHSVGLVAPYLCYMRQDCRCVDGEAITSRLFADMLNRHMDWLVTVDPHLHRYRALSEIYSVPSQRVEGAHALAQWLSGQDKLLLVGPDAESEQWVARVAKDSGHPYVIGEKQRRGDRDVTVVLPDLSPYRALTAVVIDDVIASGQTILQCLYALKRGAIQRVSCAAVHGIFADGVDRRLLASGLDQLVTCNTIPHATNRIDIAPLLAPAVAGMLGKTQS